MSKSNWDLTSSHSLERAAEWLRERSGALIVVVIRPEDGAIAADELLDVVDVHDLLWHGQLPAMRGRLREVRDDAKTR